MCWAAARAPSRSSMLMLGMPGAGAWSTNTSGSRRRISQLTADESGLQE